MDRRLDMAGTNGLVLTEVRVWTIADGGGGLVAGANVTFNDALAVRRIMLFDVGHKRFALFPGDRSGEPAAHPVNRATRQMVEQELWAAYDRKAAGPERRIA